MRRAEKSWCIWHGKIWTHLTRKNLDAWDTSRSRTNVKDLLHILQINWQIATDIIFELWRLWHENFEFHLQDSCCHLQTPHNKYNKHNKHNKHNKRIQDERSINFGVYQENCPAPGCCDCQHFCSFSCSILESQNNENLPYFFNTFWLFMLFCWK